MKDNYSLKKLFNHLVIKVSGITISLTILVLLSWVLWVRLFPRDYYNEEYEPEFIQLVNSEIDNYNFEEMLKSEIDDERFNYLIIEDTIKTSKGEFSTEEIERLISVNGSDTYVKNSTFYSYRTLNNDEVKVLSTYPAFSTGNKLIDRINAFYQIFLFISPFFIFLVTLHHQTKKLHNKIATSFNTIEENLKNIESGDLDSTLPSFRQIEFNQLSHQLDNMRLSLKDNLEKLENQYSIQKHLFSAIAHDVRTPLTIISAEAEMLELENEKLKNDERLDTIFMQVQQIDTLLSELLKIISLNSNQYSLKFEEINLVELIQTILNEFDSLICKNQISIHLNAKVDKIIVLSDIAMLNRIVGNILSNAIEHTKKNGRINVIISETNKKIFLIIENTHSQFPERILSKDFIPLTGDSKKYHFGLGMYMSNEVIKNLGGKMSLRNMENKAIVEIELAKQKMI